MNFLLMVVFAGLTFWLFFMLVQWERTSDKLRDEMNEEFEKMLRGEKNTYVESGERYFDHLRSL